MFIKYTVAKPGMMRGTFQAITLRVSTVKNTTYYVTIVSVI